MIFHVTPFHKSELNSLTGGRDAQLTGICLGYDLILSMTLTSKHIFYLQYILYHTVYPTQFAEM